MMMYELHVPLVMMANRAVERGPKSGTSKNEIKKEQTRKVSDTVFLISHNFVCQHPIVSDYTVKVKP